jgi:hypothetical protein
MRLRGLLPSRGCTRRSALLDKTTGTEGGDGATLSEQSGPTGGFANRKGRGGLLSRGGGYAKQVANWLDVNPRSVGG